MAWQEWTGGVRRRCRSVLPRCADEDCNILHGIWRRMVWRKAGIRLHDSWYCAPQCFERAAQQHFSRACAAVATASAPRHRIPLGLLLLSRGQLTNPQLRAALQAQRAAGRDRIGKWLERMGFVTEQQVTAVLGLQWACPVLASSPCHDPAAARMLPYRLLEKLRMLPVQFVAATRVFHLAFCEGVDYTALYGVEQILGCRTEACLISRSQMDKALEQIGHEPRAGDLLFEGWHDVAGMARVTCGYVLKLGAEDVRIVSCGEYIWARLSAGPDVANLLFRRSIPIPQEQDIFSSGQSFSRRTAG
jgi:hypothetical protein